MIKGFAAALAALMPSQVWACAVCLGQSDPSTGAFLIGTAILSLVPFGLIGGTIFFVYRAARAVTPKTREQEI